MHAMKEEEEEQEEGDFFLGRAEVDAILAASSWRAEDGVVVVDDDLALGWEEEEEEGEGGFRDDEAAAAGWENISAEKLAAIEELLMEEMLAEDEAGGLDEAERGRGVGAGDGIAERGEPPGGGKDEDGLQEAAPPWQHSLSLSDRLGMTGDEVETLRLSSRAGLADEAKMEQKLTGRSAGGPTTAVGYLLGQLRLRPERVRAVDLEVLCGTIPPLCILVGGFGFT